MGKDSGHLTDGDPAFDNPSRIQSKRSHQWFVDAAEPELFPNKKQVVQTPTTKSSLGISNANVSLWENASSFQPVPNQFINRLFGSETGNPVNFTERNTAVGTDNLNMRRKGTEEQFGNDAFVGLSICHATEDPDNGLSYGGIRKVKVNHVKDADNGMHAPNEHSYNMENNSNLSMGHTYNRGDETTFISMGQAYNKEDDNVTLMGHTYNRGDAHIRSISSSYDKGDDNTISIAHNFNKGDSNTISFGGFNDEADIHMVRPMSSYELYNQSSVQTPETASEKELDAAKANAVVSVTEGAKSRPEPVSKIKPEFKPSKKEAPNSFPSNVRSLISTGMLDGVPVKYISLSREVYLFFLFPLSPFL